MAIGDSTRINTNIAAFNALHALKYVNRNLEKSQLKLATGWRINEVSDDPAGFVISKRLDARSRGLSVAYDNVGTVKNVLAIAEGGTVFLDEIGDISQVFQVKLLRVLEDKVYEPLGSNKSLKANVRIVAATNKNLEQMVKERSFREDLYYRLNVLPVHIPPLRERKEDIIPLAKHFIGIQSKKNEGKYSKHFLNGSAETLLTEYPWLGNIRELRNIIEKTLLKVGPERQQIAPTDIMLQTDINDCEQSTSQKLKNDKTISIQKDTENTKNIIGEEKSRFSEIDKNQLMQLCRKIWDTKGNIIDNNVDNVPNQLTFVSSN